jgi:RNA polymerase sigma factor (sigma-70 family)
LFRICRHAAIDHRRMRRVRQQVWMQLADDGLEQLLTAPVPTGAPFETQASAPAAVSAAGPGWRGRTEAAGALRRLPAHHRVLMSLHYERGLPQTLIGQMTGLSTSAVRVRLFRARGTLSQAPDLPAWASRRQRSQEG